MHTYSVVCTIEIVLNYNVFHFAHSPTANLVADDKTTLFVDTQSQRHDILFS